MPGSLRIRLLLAVGSVVVVAVAAIGLFTSRMTRVEFDQFLELEHLEPPPAAPSLELMRRTLRRFHDAHASWSGVGPVLEELWAGGGEDGALYLAEAGGLRLAREPIAIRDEVDRVVASLRAASTTDGPRIAVELPSLPAVLGDPTRFRQIVRNLLANALAHTPADGRVEIIGRISDGEVAIAVRDSGPGIAPEHLPLIFERFYRADPARARATGGAGLGLAIVRQLVTLQGGSVRVDSRPGAGACFEFTLPIAV